MNRSFERENTLTDVESIKLYVQSTVLLSIQFLCHGVSFFSILYAVGTIVSLCYAILSYWYELIKDVIDNYFILQLLEVTVKMILAAAILRTHSVTTVCVRGPTVHAKIVTLLLQITPSAF